MPSNNIVAKIISSIALLLSLMGLTISIWATSISKHSFNQDVEAQKRIEEKNFEQAKLELLMQISDDLEIMGEYLMDMHATHVKYNTESQAVKNLMSNNLFVITVIGFHINFTIEKLNRDWENVSEYSYDKDYNNLIIKKAEYYNDLKINQVNKISVKYAIDDFNTKLKIAEEEAKKNNHVKGQKTQV